jgi:streptogramin lyase
VNFIKEPKRTGLFLGTLGLPVAVVVFLLVLSSAMAAPPPEVAGSRDLGPSQSFPQRSVATEQQVVTGTVGSQNAYVFRFDPELESFETFTLPATHAQPHSVAVISDAAHLDVWFTQPNTDEIGRLIYTSTQDYAFDAYTLPVGSEPLNLVQDGTFVWFTARQGNYVGRLEVATGQVVSFTGLTTNSHPSGIDLAPDGSVWFTEMAADRIGHLVVTTTSDYGVVEYEIPQFPSLPDRSAPYGIYVETDNKIWFAETARNQLVRLTPSTVEFVGTGQVEGEGHPYSLAYSSAKDRLWFTELKGNHVTLFNLSTLAIGLQYSVPTTDSRPYDLVSDTSGQVWFTEESGGKLGRLVVTTTGAFEEYPLPVEAVRPQGIAVDAHDKVWMVGATCCTVNLPLMFRDYPPPPPIFGVQTYWPADDAHGLQEMVDARTEWLRIQLHWSAVEPDDVSPQDYNWTRYDTWFGNLYTAGIRPVVNVDGNPDWAAQYPAGPLYPEHMEDLVEFVGAMVERYDGDGVDDAPGSPVVNHWEFYNEEDNSSVLLAEAGYGYWGHNGAGYADLLRQVWPVIKAANPSARVLMGGIAYERFLETDGGPYVRQFLDDFLAAGGGAYIDIFNFHYYPNWEDRWAPYGQGVIGKTNFLRDKLASYGVYKPIACTEIGNHSDPSRGGNDELQSRYVVQAFVRSMAADLVIVNWFAWRDITQGFPYLYGLLDEHYEPKPAYYAFETLTSRLSGMRYQRTLTLDETGTSDIEGYVFGRGQEMVYVVWTNDGATYPLEISASAVEKVGKYGSLSQILDEDDGLLDSKVVVEVYSSPTYFYFER